MTTASFFYKESSSPSLAVPEKTQSFAQIMSLQAASSQLDQEIQIVIKPYVNKESEIIEIGIRLKIVKISRKIASKIVFK